MAAPKGNSFWKLRSKHGRDKLFTSPELLWDAACDYFQWCEDNPWRKIETTTRTNGVDVKSIPTERPFTIEGLCLYCDASRSWWNEFRKAADKDFLDVITRIEEIIYKQKFEGAAVGAFNANIIARDLGLADSKKLDHTTNGESMNNLRELSTDELIKRAEAVRKINDKT